ncbi:MAG: FliM/FliN family flagellar motor switch protein [Candidatus Latescibacteria bacterium]|nr:FliM/FliN family flagellar motor switch protein [Candidatus Latescibacterota bacterium]
MAEKRIEKKAAPAPLAGELASLLGLQEVEVKITLELGRTEITLEEAMSLTERSTVVGDKMADEPVDVRINGRLFGRGKLVLVGDHYGVQLTELLDQGGPPPQSKRLRSR